MTKFIIMLIAILFIAIILLRRYKKPNKPLPTISDITPPVNINPPVVINSLTKLTLAFFIKATFDQMVLSKLNVVGRFIPFDKRIDPLFNAVTRLIVKEQKCSIDLIMNAFSTNINRTSDIMVQLEKAGIIGSYKGVQNREVYIKDKAVLEKILTHTVSDDDVILDIKEMGNLADFDFNKYIKTRSSSSWGTEDIALTKENLPALQSCFDRLYLKYYVSDITFQANKLTKVLQEQKIKRNIRLELLTKERKRTEKERMNQLKEQVKVEMLQRGELTEEDYIKREPIPQNVQDRVWNRDGGKCVKCGSTERIEFDHIIPFSKGGTNTYRNLQILCQKCNRQKHNKIG